MDSAENNQPWYAIQNVAEIDSPALVIYSHRVKANIQTAIEMIGDVQRLRPHVKTHKTKEVTRLLLQAGVIKFKCATIAEAEMLAQVAAPDVMLAYQPVGPKATRFVALVKKYPETHFSCLVDTAFAAQELSRLTVEANTQVSVFIDLNVGMNRTGMVPGAAALKLYALCETLSGLEPLGLHAYDGHITDTDFEMRTQRCNAAFDKVIEMKEALLAAGFDSPVVVAGGSATFPIHRKRQGVECSPGTFVFWDAGYAAQLPEQQFLPAALVITRIISKPDAQTLCADLGHKAVAAEGPLARRVLFLNAPQLHLSGHSEEHVVLKNSTEDNFNIGTVLYGLPFHICPTCALYNEAIVVEDGTAKAIWKIEARNRKLTL